MKYLTAVAAVCLLIVPSAAFAQHHGDSDSQLPGGPVNHKKRTVTTSNHNWLHPYSNHSTIQINEKAHLTNRANATSSATLRNESDGKIDNYGSFTNQYDTGLTQPHHAHLYNAGTFNNGTSTNYAGADLDNSGTLTNIGTLINYGTLNIPEGRSQSGPMPGTGTLTNSGSLTSHRWFYNGGTLNNTGTITFLAGSTFDNSQGTFNNNGKIVSYINDLYCGAGGIISFQSDSHYVNHATVTIPSELTITNSGGIDTSNGTFTNKGTFNFRDTSYISGGTLTNSGTLTNFNALTINSECTLSNNNDLTNSGTLTILGFAESPKGRTAGGTLSNNSGKLTNNNMLINQGTLTNYNNATLINNDAMNNSGTLTLQKGSIFDNTKGTLTNNGTIASYIDDYFQILESGANGKVVFDKGSNFVNHAKINNASGNTLTNEQTLTNATEGELTNAKGLLNNSGTLINNGMLTSQDTLINTGTLTNNGTLNNNADATMANNGTIDTTKGTFTNNGTIGGTGHIKGSVSGSGYIAPGQLSPGAMTIDGHLIHYGGGHEIELGGLFDGGSDQSLTEFDWIDVTGNVELAGLLNVELIDGFELHRGNWFDILRVGGTLSGQYEGLREGALVGNFGGQDLFITYGGMGDGGGVALFTNAVPEPTTMLIWSMLAGLGMTTRRRRAA